jgi:putative hydrolase of the HAD superfamily
VSQMLPKAILFDLDDTILASGQRPAVLVEIALEFADGLAPHAPVSVADKLEADLELFWSDPQRHKVARFGLAEARRAVVTESFAGLGLSADLAVAFADRFTEVRERMTELFPGARETLETIRARGVLMALVTNGSAATQRAKIERFTLAALFDHIQIEGEAGFGKPDEQAYLHAMQALGVTAADTWMVGDHLEWEVAAPQRLGIRAIWHDPYGRGLPEGSPVLPDRIIRRLSELLE